MIHDNNASLRVFEISELARIIAGQLTLISRKSTGNLARTCRCLEEPVLSALWEIQKSLPTLLKVLPDANRCIDRHFGNYTVRELDPPVERPNAYV